MPEIITLSFSQVANQLTTHFNNFQEDRLFKNPENLNNFTHIIPKSTYNNSKTISNLYPRSILYDYSNGTGALDPHVYFEKQNSNNKYTLEGISNFEKIQITPQISLNSYQEAINDNSELEISNIDNERTDYWSDFTRLTYNPSNVLKHPQYNYNPESNDGIDKNLLNNKFKNHQLGIDSFHNIEIFNNSVDDNIRKLFEESNNVSHMNIVLELDSAWSGICSETIKYTIDEQFNGKGSKIVLWSLQRDSKHLVNNTNFEKLDRIRKFISLNEFNIGGFISLNLDLNLSHIKNKNSLWEKTAFQSIPFDFFNSIKNDDISNLLFQLTDDGQRKFINEIRLSYNDEILNLGCNDIFTNIKQKSNKINHVFSRITVANDGFDKLDNFSDFDSLIKNGTMKNFTQNLKSNYSFNYIDTLPSEFKTAKISAASLGITNSIRDSFTDMYDFVSRYCKTDEREEFKDTLDNFRESYTFGFEPSDEENDD